MIGGWKAKVVFGVQPWDERGADVRSQPLHGRAHDSTRYVRACSVQAWEIGISDAGAPRVLAPPCYVGTLGHSQEPQVIARNFAGSSTCTRVLVCIYISPAIMLGVPFGFAAAEGRVETNRLERFQDSSTFKL